MSTVFGEDARLYDRARADYPPGLAGLVLTYAGAGPADGAIGASQATGAGPGSAAEVGAGTGKGTALFAGRGFPITCIEPDPRMSELLHARFPAAAVVTSAFEDWTPPAGGVGLLFAVMSWHWVDPALRMPLAATALAPGGTLALIGRRSQHRDPHLAREIQDAFRTHGPYTGDRLPLPEWSVPELRADPAFTDLTVEELGEDVELTTGAFLDQLQTLSPFRRRTPESRRDLLAGLRRTIDAHGGTLALRSVTSLVLARRRPA